MGGDERDRSKNRDKDTSKNSKGNKSDKSPGETKASDVSKSGSSDGPPPGTSSLLGSGNNTVRGLVSMMEASPKKTDELSSSVLKELRAENKATSEKLAKMMDVVQKLADNQSSNRHSLQYEVTADDCYEDKEENDEIEDLDQYYDVESNVDPNDYEDYEPEEGSVAERFGMIKKREAPDDLQVVLWNSARKVTEEYGEDEWKKLSIKSVVKRFVEHPGAAVFAAPKADPQLLDLQYQDRKDRERYYTEIQNAQGAVGHMATLLLLKMQDKSDELTNTIKHYADGSVIIENPRADASVLFTDIKKEIMENWAKLLSDITKVAGATFSRLLMMRRAQFEQLVGNFKGAKSQLKRLQPTKEYLYGNQVGAVRA